ncbi:MAG: hypothetical protein ACYS67_02465 [Planctomycetota bacterium]
MVLKYMITDTDLAEGGLGPPEPEKEDDKPKARAEPSEKKVVSDWRRGSAAPKWADGSSRRNTKLWFFLFAVVVLGAVGYYLWRADLLSPALDMLPTGKVAVSAIVYGEEGASAIVNGSVVHEGDTIEGYKVIKIHREEVEFERKGKRFKRKIYE